MPEANVIDPTWVLVEETGRLRYEGIKLVRRNPRQRLMVEYVSETMSPEWAERYERIVQARSERGIDNG